MVALRLALVASLSMLVACQEGATGPAGPAGPAAGRLRAYTPGGEDLGFVYALQQVDVVTTTGAPATFSPVTLAALRQLPAGRLTPVLVNHALVSGSAPGCTEFFSEAGCSGTPSAVAGGSQGMACIASNGHAYLPDLSADPASVTFASRRLSFWNVASVAFERTCVDGPGTASAFVGADMGAPATVQSRIYVAPAD